MSTTDPEARIETMIYELAYERVKESYLWQVLPNGEVDAKAGELAREITELVEEWIRDEVNAATARNTR